MRIIRSFGAFVGIFLIYHIFFGCNVFPVEDGYLQAPTWYPILGISLSGLAAYFSYQDFPKKKENGRGTYEGMNLTTFKPQQWKDNPYIQLEETRSLPVQGIVRTPLPSTGDAMLDSAIEITFETGQASPSMLQRKMNIGYAQAAKLVDTMEEFGIVAPFQGSKPREILITRNQYIEEFESGKLKKQIPEIARESEVEERKSASVPVKDRNPMEVIRLMESRFEEQYRFAYMHLLNSADCQRMYNQTVKEFEAIELPLMAQVRFEQLCAEYKEKFSVTNPFIVIDAMEGYEFERWCAELLKKNGFINVKVTPCSGDHGVDIVAEKEGVRYAIQCKCYSSDLGNNPVQEVFAGKEMYGCQVGIVMTNRDFTAGAKQLAEKTRVLLWGRSELEELMKGAEEVEP